MRRPVVLLAIQTATVTAILACLCVLAARHPWRLDLTPERRFTLSPHSREVLARLATDVRVTVFYSSQQGALRRDMADLLGLYHDAQPRFDVRFLDLDRSPGAAQRLDVDAYNVAVLEAGERRQRIDIVNEDAVTSALLAVAGTPPVPTYFVVGHGEHDPREAEARGGANDAAHALAADGFPVRVLEGAAQLPDDARLLVVAGATHDLAPAEADGLVAWVRGGGALLLLADPDAPPSIAALALRFGVELGRDLVVDERGRLFGTDGLSARVAFLNQTLVPDAPEVSALLPVAQTLRLVDTPGIHGDYLAMTPETTWADVDRRVQAGGEATFRPGVDRRGPLPVAAFVRVEGDGAREGRVVVVGDADFVTNLHANVMGNRDLLAAVAGLVARGDALAAPRPAAPQAGTFSPLALTDREARLVFWGAVVAPAAAFALAAFASTRRRRLA